jgi:endonuclease/exonuclease/phosphatase (EEP) superfamily protein YafD
VTVPRSAVLRALAVAGAVVAASSAAVTPAAAATQRVTVVQHNVQSKWGPISLAVQHAKDIGAQGITLQEVCQSQLPALRSITTGWTVNWQVSGPKGCGTNNPIGTAAIWTGGSGGVLEQPALTPDGARTPKLTCVRYGSAPVRHICSVHLVARDPTGVRDDQTADIRRLTGEWISRGHAVVVGGDFNATPAQPEMDAKYALDGYGRFNEANQLALDARDGVWTVQSATGYRRKIDDVFFSQNRTPATAAGGASAVSTASDHRMLTAWASVRMG